MAIKIDRRLNEWQGYVLQEIKNAGPEGITTRELQERYSREFPGRDSRNNIDKIVRSLIKRDNVKRTVRGSRFVPGKVVAI